MGLQKIGRAALAMTVTAMLTACHADVQAFRVTVSDGEQEYDLLLRDETRRPQEEEAIVTGAAEEPPRFRIEEFPEETPNLQLRMLELELAGDYRGGRVQISGDTPYTGSFSTAVNVDYPSSAGGLEREDSANNSATILRFDLTGAASPVTVEGLRGAEIEFTAADRQSFRIQAIRFFAERTAPTVRFPDASNMTVFDDRVPVSLTPGAWHLEDLSTLLSEGRDGVRLRYRIAEDRFRDRGARPQITLELSGTAGASLTLQAYLRPGTREVILRPQLWDIDPQKLSVTDAPDGFQLLEVSGSAIIDDPDTPISIEMSELLRYPMAQWRRDDFELFTWTLYPEILWFDTRDYEVQARLFRRLAFFVEKRGFIGSLLTDEALQGRHGWNAHNYRPEGLAAFFNAVRTTDFPLNEYELQLREIILEQGIIVQDSDGRFLPGRGGVLSVSQASSPALRQLLVAHEAMHGAFYQEPSFRRAAFDYWDNVLDPRERGFWRDFFSWMSYSPDDRYLMVNEFQGYLLQQSERAVRWYFRSRTVDRLKAAYPQRVEQFDIFLRDYPSTFVDAGSAMNQALFAASGMVGGDPYCLQLPSDQ